jgi:hypothetical protein
MQFVIGFAIGWVSVVGIWQWLTADLDSDNEIASMLGALILGHYVVFVLPVLAFIPLTVALVARSIGRVHLADGAISFYVVGIALIIFYPWL